MEAYEKYDVWPENAKRTIFNLFINGKAEPRGGTDRYFAPFDMFPSLLESLGMKLAGHRAGLGVSVFAPKSEPTLLEQMGRDRLNDQLNGRSRFYKSFLN